MNYAVLGAEPARSRLYPKRPANGFLMRVREGCHYLSTPSGSSSNASASNSPVSGLIRPRRSLRISST
jgi:hypothetical protein